MAKTETITAYQCSFKYLEKGNPLKEELKEQIKEGKRPDYSFDSFIEDLGLYLSNIVVGHNTEKSIRLLKENIFSLEPKDSIKKWRIVPYSGRHGRPFHIVKKDGKEYNFGSESTALYENNIFLFQSENIQIAIFHRQNGYGCKSVFLEVANKMLREKGMKMNMDIIFPLSLVEDDLDFHNLRLQFVRPNRSSDIAENLSKRRKKREVIEELSLNLQSPENNSFKKILQDAKIGRLSKDASFAKIKEACDDSDKYNDAEVTIRIGGRQHKIRWNDFESIIGSYDITDCLYNRYKEIGNFIGALTEIADNYFELIVKELKNE